MPGLWLRTICCWSTDLSFKGTFMIFAPASSRYFDIHGPFAGENDMESEADTDDDELTEVEQDGTTEQGSTSGMKDFGRVGCKEFCTKFQKMQLVPKYLKRKIRISMVVQVSATRWLVVITVE